MTTGVKDGGTDKVMPLLSQMKPAIFVTVIYTHWSILSEVAILLMLLQDLNNIIKEEYKMKTLYDFTNAFEELMDEALNELSPESFERFKDSVSMILDDYEGSDD